MSTIEKLRKAMERQLRTLHESGNQQDPAKFRSRWKRKYRDTLMRDPAALSQFIDSKVCHEVETVKRRLKKREGLDFVATPTAIGAFGLASNADQRHHVGRRLNDLDSRRSELQRLITQYGLSDVYEAYLNEAHTPERQRKLKKLDKVIFNS